MKHSSLTELRKNHGNSCQPLTQTIISFGYSIFLMLSTQVCCLLLWHPTAAESKEIPVKQTPHWNQCFCSPRLRAAGLQSQSEAEILTPLDKEPSWPGYSFIKHSWDKRNGKQADWFQCCPCFPVEGAFLL